MRATIAPAKRRTRRRVAALGALLLAAAMTYGFLRTDDRAPALPAGPAPAPRPRPAERFGATDLAARNSDDRGDPRARAAANVNIPFHGFCPEDGTEPETGLRPQLFELARLHSEEMLDRFLRLRREGRGSPGLRAGLHAVLTGGEDAHAGLSQLEAAPDRYEDGFDYAQSAAVLLGMRALSEHPEQALRHGRDAADRLAGPLPEGPDDAAAHALLALAARALGNAAVEREALRRAIAIDRDEPAFNLALAQNLAHTPHLDEAVGALDRYLPGAPGDVAAAQLRARLATAREIQRDYTRHERDRVTVMVDADAFDGTQAAQLSALVLESLDGAAQLLGMAPRDELLVVVYGDRAALLATTCVPTWSAGVFDGTLRLYAESVAQTADDPDGTRRRQVVRHEVLHAQLRTGRFAAPHWFHEGVAQYFAEEASTAHTRSYRMMLRNRTYIPFASLEGSFLVIDRSGDAGLAYHQSLAMVELMVAQAGRHAIATAVDYLRREGDPATLLEYVTAPNPVDGAALLRHLAANLGPAPSQ